nr:hypothetical protein [Tanacetum cinerariifolium]
MEQLTSLCEMVCQIIQKKQEEKQNEEEQAANARYWKIPDCCDDDDDYNSAIIPNETIDSLKKIFSNPLFEEEIIPIKIDQHHNNVESTHDSSLIISSKNDSLLDEFVGKLTLFKSILPGIDESDCYHENEICLTKRLLYDNSSPRPPEEFVYDNSDADIESFSPSPIPVEDTQVTSFQTLPSFPQQYPCCKDCGDFFEADHCQPPQYTVNHPIFNAHNDFLNCENKLTITQNKLMEQLTSLCEMVCQIIQKKQEEKQNEEEQAANARYWKIPDCCDDDDDYNSAII